MTEDFDTAVRSILGQMIEARSDQNEADEQLQDYRATHRPPDVPNNFDTVDTFLAYHHRRPTYEKDLKQNDKVLKKAKKEYADAADQLMLFLPEGVPLRYTYQGERSELFDTKYVIVREQGEVVIQSPSSAPS